MFQKTFQSKSILLTHLDSTIYIYIVIEQIEICINFYTLQNIVIERLKMRINTVLFLIGILGTFECTLAKDCKYSMEACNISLFSAVGLAHILCCYSYLLCRLCEIG